MLLVASKLILKIQNPKSQPQCTLKFLTWKLLPSRFSFRSKALCASEIYISWRAELQAAFLSYRFTSNYKPLERHLIPLILWNPQNHVIIVLLKLYYIHLLLLNTSTFFFLNSDIWQLKVAEMCWWIERQKSCE